MVRKNPVCTYKGNKLGLLVEPGVCGSRLKQIGIKETVKKNMSDYYARRTKKKKTGGEYNSLYRNARPSRTKMEEYSNRGYKGKGGEEQEGKIPFLRGGARSSFGL